MRPRGNTVGHHEKRLPVETVVELSMHLNIYYANADGSESGNDYACH